MTNGKKREEKNEIAQQVRDVIAKTPPLKGIKLDINPQGIFDTDVAGKIWWRVPLIATPRPRRLSALYEVLAEIEDELQAERGLDILLFVGNPVEDEAPEPALK